MKIKNREQGFTLVELMISLVLSLLVTYGIAQVLISSNQSSSSSDGVSQSQETARFVMSYFGRQIRAAGINSVVDNNTTTIAAAGCGLGNLLSVNACSSDSNTGAGDRLAIAWIPPSLDFQYPTQPGNPVVPPFARVTADCSGATPAGFTENDSILNVFWVGLDPLTNTNSLFCQGYLFDGTNITAASSAGQQTIANGVEAMHVLYGEATGPIPADGSRNVTRYVKANQVGNWNNVFAIKISVMTRSLSDVTNIISNKQYVMLDSDLYTFNDAVNRQVFSSTFAIYNYRD